MQYLSSIYKLYRLNHDNWYTHLQVDLSTGFGICQRHTYSVASHSPTTWTVHVLLSNPTVWHLHDGHSGKTMNASKEICFWKHGTVQSPVKSCIFNYSHVLGRLLCASWEPSRIRCAPFSLAICGRAPSATEVTQKHFFLKTHFVPSFKTCLCNVWR